MRPIKLELKNFGPFISETIDFRQLEDNQLFLISGRTGSGKTMLFDAMTYALYGEASTAARDEGALRSHFSQDSEPTYVCFQFALDNRVYEVTRYLPYIKPGNKTKTLPKLEVLELIGADHKLIAKSVKDGNQKIKELMKIDANQFRQILILPQGEFKKFLIANSNDKQKVLRTLFDTTRFKHLELQLIEETKELQQQVQHSEQEQDVLLSQFKSERELNGPVASQIEERRKEIADQQLAVETMEQEVKVHYTKIQQAEEELNAAKSLNNALEEEQSLTLKLKAHQKENTIFQQKEHQLKVMRVMEQLFEVQQSLVEQKRKLDHVMQEASTTEQSVKEIQLEVTEISRSIKTLNEKKQSIEQLKQLLKDRQTFFINEHDYRTLDIEIRNEENRYQDYRDQYDMLTSELKQQTYHYHELTETMRQRTESLQHYKEQQTYLAVLLKDAEQSNKDYEMKLSVKRELDDITKQQIELYNSYDCHDYARQLISQNLGSGDYCPICHHSIEGDIKIDHSVVNLHEQVTKLKERQIILETKLEMLDKTEAVEASDILFQYKQLEQTISKSTAEQEVIQSQIEEVTFQLDDIQNKQMQCHNQLTAVSFQLEERKRKKQHFTEVTGFSDYDEYWNDYSSCSKKVADYEQALAENQMKLSRSEQQLEYNTQLLSRINNERDERRNNLQQTQLKYKTIMTKHHLKEEELPETFDEAIIQELEDWLNHYREQEQVMMIKLDDLKILIGDNQSVDLEPLQYQHKQLSTVFKDHEEKLMKIRYQLDHNNQLLDQLTVVQEDYKKMVGKHEEIMTLAQLFGGKNNQKLTLENFVLTYYLEQTLKLSNTRLSQMTNYRYQFQRKTQVAQGYSGLEIEVFDNYSNKVRDISTLSGGETFLASLSLALGLSDYVTQLAGGINLDSVFIDEGFGTLDSETLETAIESLVELERSGKMVGLISHVAELKNRIPAILNVESSGYISKVKFIIK
ncbi:AAA family ATPase [Macrococcus lamae]|uniref:AAA family ATPase n=1 Tax=Macrococcus lamae TaxID=198484 RepID=UPI001409079B|nr:SMC family ATPase [Macrococcus lamae]